MTTPCWSGSIDPAVAFYVYINHTRKRARLHRQGCSYVKLNGGTASAARQEWHTRDTKAEAEALMRRETVGFPADEVRRCGHCCP